jgi:hypothetical protein
LAGFAVHREKEDADPSTAQAQKRACFAQDDTFFIDRMTLALLFG